MQILSKTNVLQYLIFKKKHSYFFQMAFIYPKKIVDNLNFQFQAKPILDTIRQSLCIIVALSRHVNNRLQYFGQSIDFVIQTHDQLVCAFIAVVGDKLDQVCMLNGQRANKLCDRGSILKLNKKL